MAPMNWPVFTTGFVLAATLIVAIGAQNAFVLRQGLRREHVGAIVLFCALSDALLMAAGVAGVGSALRSVPALATTLTVGGALFLAWYGAQALRRAMAPQSMQAAAGGQPMSAGAALAQAAAFTLLNPHVYLDTVLLVGAVGGRFPVAAQPWFVAGAALASAAWFTALGFGARLLRPVFARPAAWRVLDALVGLTMWVLAALLLRPGVGA
jgi:L-lysine exporter family protein LysE/ArgO